MSAYSSEQARPTSGSSFPGVARLVASDTSVIVFAERRAEQAAVDTTRVGELADDQRPMRAEGSQRHRTKRGGPRWR
jgi:hypothetical protein